MVATGSKSQASLLRQFSVPIRVADKLGPALVPGRVLRIDRIPLGLLGLVQQSQTSLCGRTVRFAVVALDASQNAVLPT